MRNHVLKSIFVSLILLLGVGNAWANTYYYSGQGNGTNWAKKAMTVSTDGFYEYYLVSSTTTHQFKIGTSSNQYAYNKKYVSKNFNGTNIANIGDYGGDNCYCWQGSKHYILVYKPNTTINTSSNPKICAATYLPDNRECTVYFVNKDSWNSVNAYGWYYQNNTDGSNNAWPGKAMTNTGKTYNGKQIWSYTYPQTYDKAIFNNGSSQTGDLTLGTTNKGKMYDYPNSKWIDYTYDVKVTFNANGHGTAPEAQTVLNGNKITEPTAPIEDGYTFGGWYKEAECTNKWNFETEVLNDDITLYAKWSEITHTVTFANDGNGTTNQTGAIEVGVITGIAIDATPKTDYEFNAWESSNGGSFATTAANASNTFYPTANTTLTATFRSTAVNALLVVAGANIASVTGSKEPVTLGETYNITATPKDGYSFEKWVADPEANGVFADATSANTTVTVQNASVTVTASATENMSTLTTSNKYDEGTPSIAAPSASVSEIGVTTTATITAAAGTGYTFAGWTLTNCVRTDGGADNATTITVRANGDKADAKVVANYVQNVVYFVNTKGWSTVKVYAWNDGGASNAAWSGVALTDVNIVKQIGGCDVYKYVPGANYAKVIFNNGSEQTDDLAWQNGKYYVYNSENTKDVSDWYTEAEVEGVLPDPVQLTYTVEVPAGTHECYIAGDMNGWALTKMDPVDATHFTLTIQWATNAHEYKYACGPDWKYEEVKADGSSVSNRKYNATDVVARWNCAPGIHLVGDMNNWNTAANKFQISGTTATVTIALETGVYKFKVNNDGEWLGNNGTMVRGGDGMDTGWSFESDKDACQLTADIVGDYIFTWDLTNKKLTVTYPALPKHQVTATVNPAETGEVTGTGEYEQGSEATLVATPAAGYAFKNWTIGGTEKSTEATYTFTVNEPISLVANFIPEVTHEVTVSYLCNSNPIPGHDATTLAVGVTTPSTITAPAITNYAFDNWTVGTGVQAVDATANPIQITTLAEGEYTLVANYTKIELTYTVKVPEGTEKCYIAGDMNSWSFQEMTPTANANEFTITIDGATTAHKYKYTCGESWDYVEKKADGNDLADNRSYKANDVVAKWGDPLSTNVYLAGSMTAWNDHKIEFKKETKDSKTASISLVLMDKEYEIKIVDNGEWLGNNGTITESVDGWTFEKEKDNCTLKTPVIGKYTFTWSFEDKKLSVTYPVETVATAEAKQGIFSVGLYEVAQFAPGNLQYNLGESKWTFATNQYDYIGEDNINLGDPTFTGTIDMFGWSTDETYYGVNPNNVNELYDGTFQDWGTKMGEGWETLSADQWKYLLNTRPNAASLKQIAKIGDKLGIMLFPDEWTMPAGIEVTAQLDSYFNVNIYNYTTAQWAALENAGAIFLPAAGRRAGGYGNMINYDQVPETREDYLVNGGFYRWQDNTNIYCYYWTSTINDETKKVSYLHNMVKIGDEDYTIGTGAVWAEKGRYGQSVRLAKVTSTLVELGDNGNTSVITENAGKTVDVQINRTFTADKLHTLCLPFDVETSVLGAGSEAYQLSGVRSLADGTLTLDVVSCTMMYAGQPYLVIPRESFTIGELIVENVEMKNVDVTTVANVVNNANIKVTFQGILDATGDKTNGSTHYYIGQDSYLYNGTVDILGLRSMFTITGMPAGMRARVAFGENAATGLEDITNGENTTIKVIENGQLIIIRGGEKFNAQGIKF